MLYSLVVLACLAECLFGSPELLLANRKDIRLIDIEKGKLTKQIVVKGVDDAASIDYYYKGELVCWANIGFEQIQCISINQSNVVIRDHTEVTLIKGGITSPDGLAVDWLSEKIYWANSDDAASKIEVAEIYGSNRRVLYWQDLSRPRAIALVPSEGLMFWSDWGETPKIERAGMNGDSSTRRVIVSQEIHWPNGLTVDLVKRVLYWADGKRSHIISVDFNGGNRLKIVDNLHHPFAVSYFNYSLYWTDWITKDIHYCRLNSAYICDEKKKLNMSLTPMYIQVYSKECQPDVFMPCQNKNGGCSHLCLAAPYSPNYSCSCPTGIKLLNNHTCSESRDEMLILARRTDIRIISLDTPDYTPVVFPVTGIKHAAAVEYDPVERYVYWSDDYGDVSSIHKAKVDGTEQEEVISTEILNTDGMAIDWVARNLYWSDTGFNRIEVARLDGSSRQILMIDDLDEPRGIALHPGGGLMFWTDWGKKPKIERAALDGSMRKIIISEDIVWPNGIVFDEELNMIYWGDADKDVIEVADLDGSHRKVIVSNDISHIFGFSLLGNYLYWTDWQKRTIERVDKLTGSLRQILVEQLPDLMGLKAVGPVRTSGNNPCRKNNGACSHLCFNRPGNDYVCGCPVGYELTKDNRTCILPDAFLLFAQKDRIHRVSLETSDTIPFPVTGIRGTTSIDFDGHDKRLYWTDTSIKSISRVFMNGSSLEHIVEFDLEDPESMAIDWLARNIYWADIGTNKIETAKLDGTSRRVLLWDSITSPHTVTVDPIMGFMYWSEWSEDPSISKAYMDGSHSVVIVRNIGRSNGLTVDYEDHRLFWTDIDRMQIVSSDQDGRNVKVIIRGLPHPYGLTLYGDHIYWADWRKGTIERANKVTGQNRTEVKGHLSSVTDILVFDTSHSVMQNECMRDNGNCSHLCLTAPTTTIGSTKNYMCSCPTHYVLQPDGHTCLPPTSFLLYSQKSHVSRLVVGSSSNAPSVILPIHNMKRIEAIEYDPLEHAVYWIDKRVQSILKAYENGTVVPFLGKPVDKIEPFDLAIEPLTRLLFWSCAVNNIINVTRLTGAEIGAIIGTSGWDRPRALSVHALKGLILFVNALSPPRIESIRLDGLLRQTVISTDIHNPTALVIDTEKDYLFWIDRGRIFRSNLNGGDRRVYVESDALREPSGLAVLGSYLYWIDSFVNLIERVHKETGQQRDKVLTRVSHLTDIVASSAEIVKANSKHPCARNSLCSHFCFGATAMEYVCGCPEHYILANDMKTCVTRPSCQENEFLCLSGSGGCIPVRWRCDGQSECSDGSDEMNCPISICQSHQFKCHNTDQCIDFNQLCDGVTHCSDHSDETSCCQHDEVRCHSTGECLNRKGLCSGGIFCPDDNTASHCLLEASGPNKGPYIVGVVASVIVLFCVATLVVYYRKCPASNVADQELDSQQAKPLNQPARPVHVIRQPVYKGFPRVHEDLPAYEVALQCFAGPEVCTVRSGLNVSHAPEASSSSSSMAHYPLNPPPTPITESRPSCRDQHCCYNAHSSVQSHSYKYYKSHNRPPPPTPCSTDVCDSDIYSALSPRQGHCYFSTSPYISSPPMSEYDSDPYPPPPTPQTQYLCSEHTSCPPSPFSERSYCSRTPCPPPPSPSMSD